MHAMIERWFHRLVDAGYARWPQAVPPRACLAACKIIAHRGQHDNRGVLENTLEAFDAALLSGVWGIEFDIRWTGDLQPVVFHDMDLLRIFGDARRVSSLSLRELRRSFPVIPTLEEVLERYGGSMHLMAEIKREHYPDPPHQSQVLGNLFSRLAPVQEYHFLSLDPAMFTLFNFVPNHAFLPVSQLNVKFLSRLALERGYAGVAGHYLFIGSRTAKRHQARGQQVGTGYIRSKKCLFRELNRGVAWIFSNHAAEMQRILVEI